MNLHERLRKLAASRGLPTPPSAAQDLARRLERLGRRNPRMPQEEVALALGGECIADGLIRIEHRVPLHGVHGRVPLSDLLCAPLRGVGATAPPAGLLFLDTETTGLAGGTGTLPFLLGLARIEADSLRITQFFLTAFKGEAALLDAAVPWYQQAEQLVSFNGKAFDVPLLAARYRLARRADPLSHLPHLDLLYATRIAFAARWPDCRLQTAERRLLGFARENDLPGHLVPQAWFDFVRAGQFRQVPGIVHHNRWDLVSLAALTARLALLFERTDHPEADVAAIARAFRRRGDEETAHAHLHRHHAGLTPAGLLELARLCRRRGEWQKAVEIWQRLAAQDCLPAIEQLAKYHEHISRDLGQAMRYARLLAAHRPEDPAVGRRLARLARRLKQ